MLGYAVAALTLYLGGLFIASLVAVVRLWPGSQHLTESEEQVLLWRQRIALSRERHLLLIILFMGVLGASTESAWALAYKVQEASLKDSDLLGYLIRPWIGLSVTLIFYGVLRGGIVGGAGASREINVYGTAGLAGLVGFSATNTISKLLQLVP